MEGFLCKKAKNGWVAAQEKQNGGGYGQTALSSSLGSHAGGKRISSGGGFAGVPRHGDSRDMGKRERRMRGFYSPTHLRRRWSVEAGPQRRCGRQRELRRQRCRARRGGVEVVVDWWSGERRRGAFYRPRGRVVGPTRFELAINGGRPGRRSLRAAGGAMREDTNEWTSEVRRAERHGKGPGGARGGEGGGRRCAVCCGDVLCAVVVGEIGRRDRRKKMDQTLTCGSLKAG